MNWSRRRALTAPLLLAGGCTGLVDSREPEPEWVKLYAGRFVCTVPARYIKSYEAFFDYDGRTGYESTDATAMKVMWQRSHEGIGDAISAYETMGEEFEFWTGSVAGQPYELIVTRGERYGGEPTALSHAHILLPETLEQSSMLLEEVDSEVLPVAQIAKGFESYVESLGTPGEAHGFYTPHRRLGSGFHDGERVHFDGEGKGVFFSVGYGRVQGREFREEGAPRLGRVARTMARYEPAGTGVLTRLLWRRPVRYGGVLGTEVAWMGNTGIGGTINFAWSHRGPGGDAVGPIALVSLSVDLYHHQRRVGLMEWKAIMQSLKYLG